MKLKFIFTSKTAGKKKKNGAGKHVFYVRIVLVRLPCSAGSNYSDICHVDIPGTWYISAGSNCSDIYHVYLAYRIVKYTGTSTRHACGHKVSFPLGMRLA